MTWCRNPSIGQYPRLISSRRIDAAALPACTAHEAGEARHTSIRQWDRSGRRGLVRSDLRVGKHGSALAAIAEATAAAVTPGLLHGAPPMAFTGKFDRIGVQVVPALDV